MTADVLPAGLAMGRAPVAGENLFYAAMIVNDGIDRKSRVDDLRDALAFVADRVAVELRRAHPAPPAAAFEIKRQHVRRCDGARRGQPGTDGFPAARKAGEIMKADGAGDDYF